MSADPASDPTLGDILAAALKPAPSPIEQAATGCPDALRLMADSAYANAKQNEGAASLVCYIEALTFCRLVAAHGGRDDAVRVVFLLDEISSRFKAVGEAELGDSFEAQALLFAELMAEDGDDEMATMVAATADKIPVPVHLEAQRLRKLVVPA